MINPDDGIPMWSYTSNNAGVNTPHVQGQTSIGNSNEPGWVQSPNGPNETHFQPMPYPMPTPNAPMDPNCHLSYSIQPGHSSPITTQPAPGGPRIGDYPMPQLLSVLTTPEPGQDKPSTDSSGYDNPNSDCCCNKCCEACGKCCLCCAACCVAFFNCMGVCLECCGSCLAASCEACIDGLLRF